MLPRTSISLRATPRLISRSTLPAHRFSTSPIMPRSEATSSFAFNHTMLRIKDPKASLAFYQDILGMELISEGGGKDFTLYFLAFDKSDGKLTMEQKKEQRFQREGILELTWNHGTESDESFKGYASGNDDPGRGFGHIAITVDDLEVACKRFTDLGVKFKKRPEEGSMKHIAFIYDPDGYWIEIVPNSFRM